MHLLTDEQREKLAKLPLKQRQKEILKEEYRNGEWYAKDIRDVTGDSIPKCDMWCFGAPCFVAGTLITTSEGLKPIEEISVGDKVLTHKNTFETVTERMVNEKKGIYTLQVKGSPKTEVTGNHRFWVRYKTKKWDNTNRKYSYTWTEPQWVAVENFTGKEYIAFPTYNSSINPSTILTAQEAWLLGRYVADGYIRDTERKDRPSNIKRTIFCIGKNKEDLFEQQIDGYSFNYSQEISCRKYQTSDKRLYGLCNYCGKGAENKTIPSFIMNADLATIKLFIDGYFSGDGCIVGNKYKVNSVSKKLIYQLASLIFKVYQCPYSLYETKQSIKRKILNRDVTQKPYIYELVWNKNYSTQGIIIDGTLYQKIKKISYDSEREELVYNLEVENEHSYTANGLAAHNCQDFSIAGKRAGLDGDRSSLVREVFRILSEQEEGDRPEWIIYENVKGMLSSNGGRDFTSILLQMEGLGYDCQWWVN